jgi:hypothetical protein
MQQQRLVPFGRGGQMDKPLLQPQQPAAVGRPVKVGKRAHMVGSHDAFLTALDVIEVKIVLTRPVAFEQQPLTIGRKAQRVVGNHIVGHLPAQRYLIADPIILEKEAVDTPQWVMGFQSGQEEKITAVFRRRNPLPDKVEMGQGRRNPLLQA